MSMYVPSYSDLVMWELDYCGSLLWTNFAIWGHAEWPGMQMTCKQLAIHILLYSVSKVGAQHNMYFKNFNLSHGKGMSLVFWINSI